MLLSLSSRRADLGPHNVRRLAPVSGLPHGSHKPRQLVPLSGGLRRRKLSQRSRRLLHVERQPAETRSSQRPDSGIAIILTVWPDWASFQNVWATIFLTNVFLALTVHFWKTSLCKRWRRFKQVQLNINCLKWAILGLFFHLFSSFQTHITIFTTNKCEKMSIQFMVPGFELTTFGTQVSTHNH